MVYTYIIIIIIHFYRILLIGKSQAKQRELKAGGEVICVPSLCMLTLVANNYTIT